MCISLIMIIAINICTPNTFFFSSRRRHTRSVSAFLLNRSSDLCRSQATTNQNVKKRPACSELRWAYCNHEATYFASYLTGGDCVPDDQDRKSGSAGMPRPISYAVFCLKKKKKYKIKLHHAYK